MVAPPNPTQPSFVSISIHLTEMHPSIVYFVIVCAFAALTRGSGPTSVYIDSVPEYALLEPCAENEVSSVVRGMEFGCGDGSKLTSFACFCYQSSAKYSRMISTRVTSACTSSRGQENSALEVFSKYCQLADLEEITTSVLPSAEPTSLASPTQDTSPSPLSTPAITTTSPTGSPVSEVADPPTKDRTATIAAAVAVPVGTIALGLVGLLVYMHRKKPTTADTEPNELSTERQVYEAEPYKPTIEKDSELSYELAANDPRSELAGSALENSRDNKIGPFLADNNHS